MLIVTLNRTFRSHEPFTWLVIFFIIIYIVYRFEIQTRRSFRYHSYSPTCPLATDINNKILFWLIYKKQLLMDLKKRVVIHAKKTDNKRRHAGPAVGIRVMVRKRKNKFECPYNNSFFFCTTILQARMQLIDLWCDDLTKDNGQINFPMWQPLLLAFDFVIFGVAKGWTTRFHLYNIFN